MTITLKSEEARKEWRAMLDAVMAGDTVVIKRYNTPAAAVINYDDFVALQDAFDDLRDARMARAAYEEWKRDPSTAIPLSQFRDELIADGLIDADL